MPLTVQLVSVRSPSGPPDQRALPKELPATVQSVNVTVPPSLYRPLPLTEPYTSGLPPPVTVSPEIEAETPGSTWKTRLSPPPLTVRPAAGPVIVTAPVGSANSS